MSKKVFDYNNLTSVEIQGSKNLLERIARNIECERSSLEGNSSECQIKINESVNPSEIEKDKRYPYLTLRNIGSPDKPSIEYVRYNTPVRVIHYQSDTNYVVDTNINLDEGAGLICFVHYVGNHQKFSSLPLLHASLLSLDKKGVLIAGDTMQGKTTLTVYLLQEQKADFVSDENVILEDMFERYRGIYIPKTPRVRFSTIANSNLSKVLENLSLTDSTQYIDPDAIDRIISTKSFYVDAGLAFSRQSFCNLLGTNSKESESIDVVLFPKYTPEKFYTKKVPFNEGLETLSKFGLKRKSYLNSKKSEEMMVDLSPIKLKDVQFIEIGFSSLEALSKEGFKL